MNPNATQSQLPEDCVAIPVAASQLGAPVRLSALVRRASDGGRLAGVLATTEALTCAGAIVDSVGTVLRWLQWRVQLPPADPPLGNAESDARWEHRARDWSAVAPAGVVWTGWEIRSPLPTWLDLAAGAPWNPTDASGETWRLCKDDALLRAAGLPAYSTSRHRYLYLARRQLAGGFVAASADAPMNEHTRRMTDLDPGRPDVVAFNPGAGLLQALTVPGPPTSDGTGRRPDVLVLAAGFDRELRDVVDAVRMSFR